jgi:hypothetical protein
MTRELKASDAEQILSLVAPATDYWKLSAVEVNQPSPDGLITVQVDGARWIRGLGGKRLSCGGSLVA